MAAHCATCCPAQMMKERRLFRLFSALSRFTGFPDLREGQRIGAPRRGLPGGNAASRHAIWPKIPWGKGDGHSPNSPAYPRLLAGAARKVEPPRNPRRSAINAMWEAYTARYMRGKLSPGALGTDTSGDIRRRPRPLALKHWGDHSLQGWHSPSQPRILRFSMHIAEDNPHTPGLRAWFYRWGIRAPSGRSVAIEIVRPPAQFLIVGSGRKPFSPHRRGTAAAIAAFKSHPSFSKANSLYAKTQKNIK